MNINTQLQQFTQGLANDKDFHAKLKQSPKEAILERLDASDAVWPKGMQVKVVENDKNTLNVVFPSVDKDGKLTDDDLNSLAGGEIIIALTLNSTLGVIAIGATVAVSVVGAIAAGIIVPITEGLGSSSGIGGGV